MMEPSITTKSASVNRVAVLERLLKFFNVQGIRYCVVGMTELLAIEIDSDVDIVVESPQLLPSIQLLFEFSEQNPPVRFVQLIQHEQTAFYTVLAVDDEKTGFPCFLHPDICGDYYRYGHLFLKAEELMETRISPKGERFFYTAEASKELIYYLLKRIDKNNLGPVHIRHLQNMYRQNPGGAESEIRRFWPPRHAELILTCLKSAQWQPVVEHLSDFKRTICLPGFSLQASWRELQRKIRRVFQPSGLWVAFMGPDGCGKSSISERVESQLSPVFRKTRWMHLHPRLGQHVSRESSHPNTTPHLKKNRGFVFSALKQAYYLLDYCLGFWLKVYPQLVCSTFVLFDRYLIDLKVDPRRFRFSGPLWLIDLFGFLVPKPDLYFLLDAPAEVLQARKQEVTLEETSRQREAYLQWANNTPKCHVLDATLPITGVAAMCDRLILEAMAERTKRRFRQ